MASKTKAETSLVDRITIELKASELTRKELSERLGVQGAALRNALAYLVDANRVRRSETASAPRGTAATYSLIPDYAQVVKRTRRRTQPRTQSGSGVIAGRITIPQYRWGSEI